MGITNEIAPAREREQGHFSLLRQFDSRQRWRRHADQRRDASHHRLMGNFDADPARNEKETISRLDASTYHRADHLVQGIMTTDVLAQQSQVPVRVQRAADASRVKAARRR